MFKNYLKIAFRNLLKYKTISLINFFGLAMGMACSILILLFVRDELSFDTYHENKDRIVRAVNWNEQDGNGSARTGAPWGPTLKEEYPEVEDFVRFRFFGRTLIVNGETRAYESGGLYADSSIFNIFSFELLQGDPSTALTQPNSVVITESLAEKYFGEDDPVGQNLLFDNSDQFKVTGVVRDVPRNSHFSFNYLASFVSYDFWDLTEWRVNNFHLYLLLKEGVDPKAFEAKLPAFLDRHIAAEQRAEMETTPVLQKLTKIHLHSNLFREFRPNGDIKYVYLFLIVAGFILLIACINFMNLATARAAKRAREVGMRKVIGAERAQLVRQFMGESLLLCLFSLFLAITLVELLLPYFNTLTGKTLSVNYFSDPLIITSFVGVAVLTGLISGSYPAIFLSSFRPIATLKSASPAGGSGRLRKILVVAQFTVSIALIASTGVIYQQMQFIQNKKLGFNKDQVLVIRAFESNVTARPEAFRSELLRLPSIKNVSTTSNLPGGSDWGMPFMAEIDDQMQRAMSRVLVVDEAFQETMETQVTAGRWFSKDFPTDAQEAFIVNQTAARQFGWDDPIGKRMSRPIERGPDGNWLQQEGRVVGVVEDFHFRSLHQEIQPLVIYMAAPPVSYLLARIETDNVAASLEKIEQIWKSYDSSRPFDYFFLDQVFDQLYSAEQRLGQTFTAFAFLALLIGCLGLFGLAAFAAEQRTKEIGVRKVLGATISNIILLLSREFTKLVFVAFLIGSVAAWFGMEKWLENFAYRIDVGAGILAVAGLSALLIAWLTVSVQSIRAASANPVKALKYE